MAEGIELTDEVRDALIARVSNVAYELPFVHNIVFVYSAANGEVNAIATGTGAISEDQLATILSGVVKRMKAGGN